MACLTWKNAAVLFDTANWKWSVCPGVTSPCVTWKSANFLFDMANWRWSECSSSNPPIPPQIIGNPPGVDATTLIQPWVIEPWNPYRSGEIKKKKISLICRIGDKQYEMSKDVDVREVSVDDVDISIDTSKPSVST